MPQGICLECKEPLSDPNSFGYHIVCEAIVEAREDKENLKNKPHMEHFDKQNIERCIKRIKDLKREAFEIKVTLSEIKPRAIFSEDYELSLLISKSIIYISSIVLKANEAGNELNEILK